MNAMQEATEGHDAPGAADLPGQTIHAAQPGMQMRMRDPRSKSPALAAILSMMPGLGQVYIGYYQRGFVHILVIASIIAILASGHLVALIPLLALFMAFFWCYNMIDAARRAALYNEVLAGRPVIDLPKDFSMPGIRGSIFGGVLMILIGFVLLLNTRFGVSLAWLEEWWPVVPMLFGGYLLFRALQERREEKPVA